MRRRRLLGLMVVALVGLPLLCQGVLAQAVKQDNGKYTVRFIVLEGQEPLPADPAKPGAGQNDPKGNQLPLLTADVGKFVEELRALRPDSNYSLIATGALTCLENEPGEAEFHATGPRGSSIVMKVQANVLSGPPDQPGAHTALISFAMSEGESPSDANPRVVERGRMTTMVGMNAESNTWVSTSDTAGFARVGLIVFSAVPGGLWTDEFSPGSPAASSALPCGTE